MSLRAARPAPPVSSRADEHRRGRCPSAFGAAGACVFVSCFAGCGGGAPLDDLFAVSRTGSIPGARLELVVTDDGRASCNRRPLVGITSGELITARQIRRDLRGGDEDGAVGPAQRHLTLPPGSGSILRYTVRAEAGTVAFADTSPRQPAVFRRIAALTRQIARGACGLPR